MESWIEQQTFSNHNINLIHLMNWQLKLTVSISTIFLPYGLKCVYVTLFVCATTDHIRKCMFLYSCVFACKRLSACVSYCCWPPQIPGVNTVSMKWICTLCTVQFDVTPQ